ncbi:MAG: hypothetical protein D6798_05765 [Deltaproteobacteria bacterium]|nr:MAG: hypothetical protein D6798_05765 [Deltaproteobacteria bacterium]
MNRCLILPDRAVLLGTVTALLVTACAVFGSVRGTWTGDCDFSDGDYGGPIFLDIVIEQDLGRRLRGVATVTIPDDGIFDVDLDGERAGGGIILEMTIPSGTGELALRFEGSRDADDIEGSCQLWVPGATAPIVGRGELSR